MSNYTTETNGVGDLGAAARHKANVRKMARAAAWRRSEIEAEQALSDLDHADYLDSLAD